MSEDRLHNTLKVHRALHDWTQAELAERVGVTRKTINAVERGHFVPSTVLALRLAELFQVPLENLFQLPGSAADAAVPAITRIAAPEPGASRPQPSSRPTPNQGTDR